MYYTTDFGHIPILHPCRHTVSGFVTKYSYSEQYMVTKYSHSDIIWRPLYIVHNGNTAYEFL